MKPSRLLPLVLLLTALSAHAKDFIIYDRMDYVGKPDLTADKLSKVFLVYESELVKPDPTGKRKHGVLNEARIREFGQTIAPRRLPHHFYRHRKLVCRKRRPTTDTRRIENRLRADVPNLQRRKPARLHQQLRHAFRTPARHPPLPPQC